MATVICINPFTMTIAQRPLHSNVKELQSIIGGFVEVVALTEHDIMYVHEMPRADAASFRINAIEIKGTAIVVGVGASGDDGTPKSTVEDITRIVTF